MKSDYINTLERSFQCNVYDFMTANQVSDTNCYCLRAYGVPFVGSLILAIGHPLFKIANAIEQLALILLNGIAFCHSDFSLGDAGIACIESGKAIFKFVIFPIESGKYLTSHLCQIIRDPEVAYQRLTSLDLDRYPPKPLTQNS